MGPAGLGCLLLLCALDPFNEPNAKLRVVTALDTIDARYCLNTVYLGSIHQVLSWPLAGCRSCRVVNRVHQRGSIYGSITGPISVASGCFPLSKVLIGFAKLFRLRGF